VQGLEAHQPIGRSEGGNPQARALPHPITDPLPLSTRSFGLTASG
jgi:hypothetical protein